MNLPKMLIYAGLFLVGLGVIFFIAPKVPGLDRLGKLPGDIRIEKKNFTLYFPWVSCLLISLVLTFLVKFFRGLGK